MADDGLEKEHEPSGKRLGELRRQGQALRSKDLSGGIIVISGIIGIVALQSYFKINLEKNFTIAYTSIIDVVSDENILGKVFYTLMLNYAFTVLPIMIIALVAVFVSPVLYGGWNFTLEPLAFNFNKFNMVNNLSNIFGLKMFADMGRSLLKFIILMGGVVIFSYIYLSDIMHAMRLPAATGLLSVFLLLRNYILFLCLPLIVVIAMDAYYHYRQFMNKNKMSTQELKDEAKESEGNPEIKGKIRAKQLAILRQRLTQTVPKANVVVTNPTHYAVALRYDETKDHAPKIVAMGKDLVAAHIRQIAISNAVPLYEAPVLARAIYRTGKVGQEIHADLYMAVAIVLTYIYQLKSFQQGIIDQAPLKATNLQIPPSLHFDS